MNNKILSGIAWKLLERFGVLGTQFVLQIVLARILSPEHYGVLSLMVIFTNLANIFVQSGLNTALIQNKDVTEEDYSSVFWVSLCISIGLYVLLFCAAPWIAEFYDMPDIVAPFRVLALMLIPGAFNSVQLAKISREMDFKQVFRSNLVAIITSGVIGILLAYLGAGLWALVVQTLINVVIACIVMWFTVKWRPKLILDFRRIKVLFTFGWKLLVSSLLDTLYGDLSSLVIGKKYDSGTLGYYNRGKQFPQFVINAINSAVQSVMLPAMSAQQDNTRSVKLLMRNSMSMSAYIIFPMMTGLAAVAEPFIELLLTEKWLPCVPYMQIYCFALAFIPVHTCNLQTINAMGRSDLFLKLEIIKKSYGILVLAWAVFCFDSPIIIAMTGLVTTWINWFINSFPNKKLIQYTYMEQIRDVVPSLVMSLLMCGCVLLVGLLDLHPIILLIVQVTVGGVVYLLLSIIIKPEPFVMVLDLVKRVLNKK